MEELLKKEIGGRIFQKEKRKKKKEEERKGKINKELEGKYVHEIQISLI